MHDDPKINFIFFSECFLSPVFNETIIFEQLSLPMPLPRPTLVASEHKSTCFCLIDIQPDGQLLSTVSSRQLTCPCTGHSQSVLPWSSYISMPLHLRLVCSPR